MDIFVLIKIQISKEFKKYLINNLYFQNTDINITKLNTI